MNRKTRAEYRPTDWQMNPDCVTNSRVQYWRNGIMAAGRLTQAEARKLVADKMAFVISEQAIGCLIDGISYS